MLLDERVIKVKISIDDCEIFRFGQALKDIGTTILQDQGREAHLTVYSTEALLVVYPGTIHA